MANKLYDSSYLEKMQTFFRRTKERSYELLSPCDDDFIIDVGCGTGSDVCRIAQSGATVVGVDHDPMYIQIATSQNHPENASFICCEAAQMPFKDNSASKIRFDRVFQHIQNHDETLAAAHRVLKDGGQLQIIDSDYLSWALFLEDWKLEQKILHSLAYQRIPHAHQIRRLPRRLVECGFKIEFIEVHNYLVKDFDLANYIIKFDCIIEDEIKNKAISSSERVAWEAHKRKPAPLFNISINLLLIIARKCQ